MRKEMREAKRPVTREELDRQRTTMNRKQLTAAEALQLQAIMRQPGWEVLMDMMERECILFETELLNTKVTEEQQVLAMHKLARAAWVFFTRLQKKCNFEAGEVGASQPPAAAEEASQLTHGGGG